MANSTDFSGLRVAAFESRRAKDMARLIERHGGEAFVSPSMCEKPLEDASAALEFARDLIAGKIDVVIFLTGVGFRRLLETVECGVPNSELRTSFLAALADRVTIARGPKPVAAMKAVGLSPTHRVGEPNTWREMLELIDAKVPVAGLCVAVQEYGKPNQHLTQGLEDRGAKVISVEVYRWEMPDDIGPLQENAAAIAEGRRDVALFTSAQQLANLLEIGRRLDIETKLRDALQRLVIGSIGPTTSEALRDEGVPVDIEPEHPKMGHLVAAAAEQAGEALKKK